MKVAILGYGSQGRAAFEYWQDKAEVTICDQNTELQLPEGALGKLGDDHLQGLDEFDIIVRSPIVHPNSMVTANSPAILEKVTTVTNEFLRICPTKNVVGVTGTKGKGTTSTLIARMLEATGKKVHLGGNIGTPPLDLLKDDIQADDWVVLELANFQLIDLKSSPHIAVCLMVAPEHTDWHTDVEEYYTAKKQLFAHQTPDDVAVYYGANQTSQDIAAASPGTRIPYLQEPGATVKDESVWIADHELCKVDELKLLGEHNWQNICAAVTAVWQISQDASAISSALTNFTGLPFRIELRKEVNGVKYYNDSFATGPPATVAAINSVPGMKVMIIGGHDRDLPLEELTEALAEHSNDIRNILLVGASAERTAQALRNAGITNFTPSSATTMPQMVADATALTQPGDAVVLSPAFASFGLFKNFEDRGIQFNQAVDAL